MNMLHLNPPIPVRTPDGKGMAHVLLGYGQYNFQVRPLNQSFAFVIR